MSWRWLLQSKNMEDIRLNYIDGRREMADYSALQEAVIKGNAAKAKELAQQALSKDSETNNIYTSPPGAMV